nr:Unknown Function [uncultured bacterium]
MEPDVLLQAITFLGIMLVVGAIAGGIAGLVQWIVLRPAGSEGLAAWVRYNAICWPVSLAASLLMSLVFVILGDLFRWDVSFVSIVAIVGVGAIAGCVISHKLIQPALSISLWGPEEG